MNNARLNVMVFLVNALWICTGGTLLLAGDGRTWPQWRGPERNGHVSSGVWPKDLSESHLVKHWRVELPPSYSGPVVSTDRVFVTYTRDKKFEGVRALDHQSGREVWKAEWEGAMTVAGLGTSMGSWIRATPTLAGEQLIVAGTPDVLVCLGTKSGAERRRADFHARYGTPLPELGFVCSPLVVKNGIYVQTADSFVKVDKKKRREPVAVPGPRRRPARKQRQPSTRTGIPVGPDHLLRGIRSFSISCSIVWGRV